MCNKEQGYYQSQINTENISEVLNEMSERIHKQNVEVGWWDNPNPCIFEKLQLVSTEIAEATEAERKDLMDDKLPHRKGGEVELADALIRVLDLGGYLGLTFQDTLTMGGYYYRNWSIGKRHLEINAELVMFSSNLDGTETTKNNYSILIKTILDISDSLGYDIITAAEEKIKYNLTRVDHKRENREKANGKKF